MNNLEYVFHVWDELYDKNKDAKSVIENFFHDDYTQCINDISMNRHDYINHVDAQKKNIESMDFKCKNYLSHAETLFILYYANGKNIDGKDIKAEVIAYFEFKDNKVFRVHGQVQLLKGNPSDVDMNH
jgi:hypothetical protein